MSEEQTYYIVREVEVLVTGTVIASSLAGAVAAALRGEDSHWDVEMQSAAPVGTGRGPDVIVFADDEGEVEIVAAQYAEEHDLVIATCHECGVGMKIAEHIETVRDGIAIEGPLYRHGSGCPTKIEKRITLDGYLLSGREVEFTDTETGELGYGIASEELASRVNLTTMLKQTVVARGSVQDVEWRIAIPTGGRDTFIIEDVETAADDGESA